MVAGTHLGARQWLAQADKEAELSLCLRQLCDFMNQCDEPSQMEAPNATQLCNWDGSGPERDSSLCVTFGESCSKRLGMGGRSIANNKPLCLVCNELVINGPALDEKCDDYRAALAKCTGPHLILISCSMAKTCNYHNLTISLASLSTV